MHVKPRITGRYETTRVGGEEVRAFIPYPLPPKAPSLHIDTKTIELLHKAETSLAQLNLAGDMVPSLDWFIYAFVRKEAVISSQIEGTQATLMDLLTFEAQPQNPETDKEQLDDVCNYLSALTYARKEMFRKKGLPLSMRLLNETHRRLLKGARGAEKQPGQIRRTQNWIAGTRPGNALFVPPPPHALAETLSAFEKFMHARSTLCPLIRAALLHAQFETIHPYLDGNGRIGRLLVTLLLEEWRLLRAPLLYLSLYYKRHQQEYYHHLNAVRTKGDWEGWTTFFLSGVATVSHEAVQSARDLFTLVTADRERILYAKKGSLAALRLFEKLPKHPIVTVTNVVKLLRTTKPTAIKAIAGLTDLAILTETSGRKRDRTFGYKKYLDNLRQGTELP